MAPKHHILNAACNLLGISLLIIAGLHISNTAEKTVADEIAWISSVCFSVSCVFSYLAIRSEGNIRDETVADRIFLIGLFALLVSVAVLAMSGVR